MRGPHLPPSAAPAWQAYNAMEATKQRHIALLTGLEQRYGSLAGASAGEADLLDRLLRDHDAQVKRFREQMSALREDDAPAHDALIAYIREINEALAHHPPEK